MVRCSECKNYVENSNFDYFDYLAGKINFATCSKGHINFMEFNGLFNFEIECEYFEEME